MMTTRVRRSQNGMTLLEVLVTLGVLSVIFISTLQFYASTYAFLRNQEALTNVLLDANRIMTLLAEDIRGAETFLPDVSVNQSRTVVAAFEMRSNRIVYSIAAEHPTTLRRSVHTGDNETFVDLSSVVRSLSVADKHGLISVSLVLDIKGTGRAATYQVASAYAMKP